ncbi:MAG: sigma-54-dependent transcriptional regulator [Balneolaceae bacterium]
MKAHILIADDERDVRESLAILLQEEGYSIKAVVDGEKALKELDESTFDILITDLKMPNVDGIELLEKASLIAPNMIIVVITAFATVETAVKALRNGASDYIMKPLDFDEVLIRIEQLLKHKKILLENRYLRKKIDQNFNLNYIIGESETMKKVYKMIDRVSGVNTNILITGKSGTGKELVARAIHANSPRKDGPFIAINCGAIPENLVESELFGHKKGSFTGASENKDGVFVAASGGSLFLDEIGDLPLNVQVNLLRVLQEREVKPIGSNQVKKFDSRVICATNKNLKKEVEEGRFRDDLYYRLNIVEIEVPGLAERREDIPLLVDHFVNKYRKELKRPIKGVDSEAMNALIHHDWKGEVRELENVIERAMLLTDNEYVQPEDLPEPIQSAELKGLPNEQNNLQESLQAFEKHHIKNVLKKTSGNRSEAARLLSIDPSTLYRKMEKLGIVESQIK